MEDLFAEFICLYLVLKDLSEHVVNMKKCIVLLQIVLLQILGGSSAQNTQVIPRQPK